MLNNIERGITPPETAGTKKHQHNMSTQTYRIDENIRPSGKLKNKQKNNTTKNKCKQRYFPLKRSSSSLIVAKYHSSEII